MLAINTQYLPSRGATITAPEADLEEDSGLVAADAMVIVIAKASGADIMIAPALRTGEGVGRGVRLGVDTWAAEEM